MDLTPFRIKAGVLPDQQLVELDGTNVSKYIRRVTLDMSAGNIPILFIEWLAMDGDLEGTALVQRYDTGPSVSDVLKSIDPQELEARALELLGDGLDGSMATAWLQALQEAVDGDD